MALSLNVETSLGVDNNSNLLPLDFEGTALVGLPSSANIRIFSISADGSIDQKASPAILPPPLGTKITASSSSAQTNALVMAVSGAKAPQILLYGLRAGLPQLKTTIELPSPFDTAVSAIAISRDAKRVVAFGSAPNFSLSVFDIPSGVVCAGSEPVRVPGLVTQASFCPGNPDLLAACGPGGLFFYNLKKSHDKLEAVLTRPLLPSGASSDATLANSSAAQVADDLDHIQSVFLEAAEAVEVNAASAGLHPSAAAVAAAAIIAKGGANVWLSITWLSELNVAASNGAGELVVFNPYSGEVQAVLNLSSRERMNGQVSSGSVIIATSLASTLRSLIVGCSDGIVRYLTLPLRVQGVSALTSESASFLSPISTNSSLFPLAAAVGLTGSSTDVLGNNSVEVLTSTNTTPLQQVTALAVSVSNPKHRAYAVTAGGTFHSIPMGSALSAEIAKQAEASASSLSSSSSSSQTTMVPALFDYQSSQTISAVAINGIVHSKGHVTYFATADANGIIRIWAAGEVGGQILTASSLISSTVSAPIVPVSSALAVEDTTTNDDDTASAVVVDIAGSSIDVGGFIESKDGKEDEHHNNVPAVVAIDSVKASSDSSSYPHVPDEMEKFHASSSSSSSSSSSPPLVVTSMASHSRLPILAVGASDGSVSLVLVNTHSCTLLHRDFAHSSPVTSLLFGRHGESINLLVSVSATEQVSVLHDISSAGDRSKASAGAPTIARAVICLPGSKSTQGAHFVSAVAIASAGQNTSSFDVYFGCVSGHVLSISVDFASIKQQKQGNGLADLTSSLQIRGRMSSGIASLAVAEKAVKGSTTAAVLFAALAGEKSVCAVPLDSPWLAPHAITSDQLHDEQGAFESIPSQLKAAAFIPVGKQSASSVLVSPSLHSSNNVLIASGARNGTISVVLASMNSAAGSGKLDVSISSSATASVHAGPVTSLAFSGSGRRLFSAAPAGDGMCGVLVLSGESLVKAESATAHPDNLTANEEALLHEFSNLPSQRSVPYVAGFVVADHIAAEGVDSKGKPVSVLTRLRSLQEAASKAQHQQAHDALLGEVESFRARLRGLLSANASARPLERLDRREFVLDGVGRDRILAEFDEKVVQRKAAYQAECASLDADTKALRASCVDNLESPSTEIKALTTDTSVKNFAVLKRVPADIVEMDRLATLRFVEIEAMENDPSTERVGGSISSAFSGLSSYFPADIDWVYHAGLLAPTTDIAKQHEDILASKLPGAMKKLEASNDGSSTDSSSSSSSSDAPKEKKAKDGDEKEGPKSVQWQGDNVKKLFYHPAAVRTSAQKRTQVKLITELIRATQVKFNTSFDKLRHDKAEVIDAIKTRHARIRDILLELGTPVAHMTEKDQISQELQRLTGKSTASAVAVFAGLSANGASSSDLASATSFTAAGRTPIGPVAVSAGGEAGMQSITDPYLSPVEDPLTSLKVSDAEVGLSPYISPAEQRRRAEEEAKKKQAAAANKDDAPERALNDMMGGTLEGKNELDALADSLVREPWMDTVPLDQMTPEQKTALAAYNKLAAALEDERAKARNTLQAELTKLVGELKDIVDSFEAKVSTLVKTRTTTAAIIQAQEMYIAKLVSTAQVREESAVIDKALVSQSDRLMPLEDASVQAHETFKAQVEILQREVEGLAAIDRSLENGFKAALKDADQTVDPDLFKIVLSLFRKRETVSTAAYAKEAAAALAAKTAEREAALQLLLPQNSSVQAKAAPKPITLARQPSLKGKDAFKGLKAVDTALVSAASAPLILRPELDTDPYLYSTDATARAMEEEARQAAARDAIILPLQKADLPEGFEGLVNEPAGLFALVNTLRTQKIESEFALSSKTRVLDSMKAHLAFLAGRYEKHKNAIDSIQAARESILHKRELGLNDIDLLLRLRMGQDEVSANNYDCTPHPQGGAPEVDWSHAILGPADLVEVINGDVRKLGQVKVDSLTDIKSFRKGLIYQKWEQMYRRARADDEDEFHRDLQLMRAVGSVREFITGVNIQLKARQEVDRVEQKIAHLKKSHERALSLTEKATAKLESAIEQRKKAMASLARQTVQLKEGVALREAILRSRGVGVTSAASTTSGGGANGTTSSKPPINPTDEKMKTVALHGKLHAVAKEQALEIATLRKELSRALERSFPSWTQAVGK